MLDLYTFWNYYVCINNNTKEIHMKLPKAGEHVINNNGEEDFIAEIEFVEDGEVFFTSGQDQYYSPVTALSPAGIYENETLWLSTTYEG